MGCFGTRFRPGRKVLPDFVIAWLLQRSGLDATEKSVIVANLKNDFSTSKVKATLKLTWPDEELKRRDTSKSAAMFTTEESVLLAEDDEPETMSSWNGMTQRMVTPIRHSKMTPRRLLPLSRTHAEYCVRQGRNKHRCGKVAISIQRKGLETARAVGAGHL